MNVPKEWETKKRAEISPFNRMAKGSKRADMNPYNRMAKIKRQINVMDPEPYEKRSNSRVSRFNRMAVFDDECPEAIPSVSLTKTIKIPKSGLRLEFSIRHPS